jgi:7-cyano-7-deazaguanine reductase
MSSLCPKTGQPDFAEVEIRYIPNEWCVETKSLKLYLFAYRQEGAFMETITNRILEHLVEVLSPRRMTVECRFNPRGGIALNCVAVYEQPKTEYAPEVK